MVMVIKLGSDASKANVLPIVLSLWSQTLHKWFQQRILAEMGVMGLDLQMLDLLLV